MQSFYSDEFQYSSLPDDLIEITSEKHMELYAAIKTKRYVFSDLTILDESRPSRFHEIDIENRCWIDKGDESAKFDYEFDSLSKRDRMSFRLILLEHDIDVASLLRRIKDSKLRMQLQIRFEDSSHFRKDDEFCTWLFKELGYTKFGIVKFWKTPV